MTVTTTATTTRTLYVYGITLLEVRPPRSAGVAGAPVRLLHASGLCAAVSDPPERLRPRRRDLAAHQEVLAELAAQGPVLPMRFAVVSPGADALRARLRDGHRDLTDQLDTVRDRVEMNLKGTVVPGYFAELVRRDERLRALAARTRRRPGYQANVRLGEALAGGVRAEARRAAQQVLTRLAPLAVRTAGGEVDDDRVLSMSFLLRAADEQRFRDAVADQARALGDRLALSVTGPLPCYSFVDAGPAAAPGR
ncbi:MAG: GvpL/GvpF family gas vesicle protein [Streptomyces sp.]|nr:GvpL/GvpF family gas vesicle protein [Streptomyces sp.]